MRICLFVIVALTLSFRFHSLRADDASLREQAAATAKKAATFYREQVASHGGYVYFYSLDLEQRWGEGPATRDQIWIQPPGTPTVGLAFLKAYEATGDKFYLEAATSDRSYLEPIPRALSYLKRSRLADGNLARYYELKTNRPLYMVRRGGVYSLTCEDSNLPTHYGWKWESRLDELETEYDVITRGGLRATPEVKEDETRRIISALDDRRRWVSVYRGERLVGQTKMPHGAKYLSSDLFSRNLIALSEFLLAKSTADPRRIGGENNTR